MLRETSIGRLTVIIGMDRGVDEFVDRIINLHGQLTDETLCTHLVVILTVQEFPYERRINHWFLYDDAHD